MKHILVPVSQKELKRINLLLNLSIGVIIMLVVMVAGLILFYTHYSKAAPKEKQVVANHYFEIPEEWPEAKVGDTLNCIVGKDTSVIEFKNNLK